jgi:hypothetical protein
MKIDLNDLVTRPMPEQPAISNLPIRPPIISPEGELRIDNSSLERFNTCARSAEYYLLARREGAQSGVALQYGKAFHLCVEHRYKNYGREMSFEDIGKCMEEVAPLVHDLYRDFVVPADNFRTPERVLDVFFKYLCFYQTEPFTVFTPSGQPFVEQYFEVPLGTIEFNGEFEGHFHKELRILWCGKIDLAVELDGGLWIMDHKTTSILGMNYWDSFLNSSQAMGYTYGGSQLFDRKVEGLFLNVICSRKVTKTGVPEEFERQRFPFSLERIAEWKFNTLTLVGDFLAHLKRGYFPQQTAWCVGKYGRCEYLDVCMQSPSERLQMLNSNFYRDVTWTPKND